MREFSYEEVHSVAMEIKREREDRLRRIEEENAVTNANVMKCQKIIEELYPDLSAVNVTIKARAVFDILNKQ